jgi:hypothetical protein
MQNAAVAEWLRRGALITLTTTAIVLTGCGGGGGGGKSAANADSSPVSPAPGPAGNTPPTISGSPATEVSPGGAYVLSPVAQDADGDELAFSIENRPVWASFNTATGQLSGTPATQDVGTTQDIRISVSDGTASAALPAFSITVALGADAGSAPVAVSGDAVTLSWDVPTRTLEGETLGDLSGYRVYYGKSADMLTEAVEIQGSGSNTYVVQKLETGTYYFAVRAVTQSGAESPLSNVISRTIG